MTDTSTKRIVRRPLFLALAALAAVSVAGAVLLPRGIDRVVTAATEASLGVTSSVRSVGIHPLRARLTLEGIQIDAPPGYTGDYALAIDYIGIHPRLRSLASDVFVIDSLIFRGTELVMEQRGASISTRELARHIERYVASAQPEPGRPIRVTLVRFDGGLVTVNSQAGVLGSARLPPLTLREVGGEEGLPLGALIANVVEPVLASSSSGSRVDRIRDRLGF